MPTIIDSLIVKLGLDTSDFSAKKANVDAQLKSANTNAEKTNTQFKKFGRESSQGFENVAKSAAKFFAVIGSTLAVKQFVESQIAANAALGRFAENINLAVESISAWSLATELAGGSAEGLQGTLDALSRSQTELQLTGQSHLIPFFSALSVSMADAEGKARPVTDILLDLADRFSHIDRPTANNIGRMMGIDQGTLQLLLKGRTEVELLIAKQKENNVVTKRQTEEATRLRNAMVASRQSFESFGRELLSVATPALEKLFALFNDFGAWVRENKEFVTTFLALLAVGLTAVAAAVIPINLTAAAITGLAAAIALLWQDYQTWKRGGDSLIDWGKWEPGIKAAGAAIVWLKDLLGDLIYRGIAAADAVASVFSGDFGKAKYAAGQVLQGNGKSYGDTTSPTNGPKLPRGIRNNNPGNLDFAGQTGATKEGGANGRFAVFGSQQAGLVALVKQIGLYVNRGKNTIRKIIQTYAPPSENNTEGYISAVAKSLGIGADQPLDPNSAQQIMGLVKAIINHENGPGYVSDADISSGYAAATQFAQGAGAANNVSNATNNATTTNKSVETNIGEIKVYTNATDADGIAQGMKTSMDFMFTAQANYGVS